MSLTACRNVVLALTLSLATGFMGLVSEAKAQAPQYESSAR
jgi:hypothetical protein